MSSWRTQFYRRAVERNFPEPPPYCLFNLTKRRRRRAKTLKHHHISVDRYPDSIRVENNVAFGGGGHDERAPQSTGQLRAELSEEEEDAGVGVGGARPPPVLVLVEEGGPRSPPQDQGEDRRRRRLGRDGGAGGRRRRRKLDLAWNRFALWVMLYFCPRTVKFAGTTIPN